MNYNLPIFEITIDGNEQLGIDEIALVENPAIEALWVAMAKEETIKLAVDGDKQILTGPALIPDKLIYRVHPTTKQEYYIKFSADVIRQIAERFFKQQKTVNFLNIEHDQNNDVQGTVLEAWIVEDTKMDKSALYGFEMPVGTWMLSVHIDNTEFWNQFVKTNIVRGFSIEGQLGLDLVELSTQVKLLEPKKGEHETDYIPRCIAYHIGQEGMDPSQAAAICHSKWDAHLAAEVTGNTCPIATQDIATNLANRQKAIDVAHYGPLDPNLPNEEYWKAKAKMFNDNVDAAKQARCANCSFFNVSKAIKDCIAKGIGTEGGDPYAVIDAGDLGYCEAFDFKCASSRTCDAWVAGGPVTMNKEELRVGDRVSFDYDGTISTRIGKQLARKEIQSGSTVYIISARSSASGMYPIADELGIPHDRVFAMGGNIAKVEKIKELKIDTHYDNNRMVKRLLPKGIGVNFTLTAEEAEILIKEIIKQHGKSKN